MATRVCPNCGSQYVASVRRCIDCDVMLVDDRSSEGSSSSTVSTSFGDQVAYELEGWGTQLRQSLAGMLDLAEIPFVWEAGTLVVAAPFEEQVDRCIAAVEGGDVADLDDEAELVAFDIEGVTVEELEDLDGRLLAQGIAHSWSEDGELLVAVESEEPVAAMIEEILASEGPADDDDGMALHRALDALFVAVDKLIKDPGDAKLVVRYVAAADAVDGLGLPYGMAGAEWNVFLAQVEELRRTVVPEAEADDEGVDAEDVEADADAEHGAEAHAEDDASEGDAPDDDGAGEDDADDAQSTLERARELAVALRIRLRDLV